MIASVGNSGEFSTGPHLHFELWINEKAVNPSDYIDFSTTMTLKSILAIPFAKYTYNKEKNGLTVRSKAQQRTLTYLIKQGRSTAFGKDHDFNQINDYVNRLKVEFLFEITSSSSLTYIELLKVKKRVVAGQPAYLAKTSGTTSGAKYIPITAESMKEQVRSSKNALCFISHRLKTPIMSMVK